MALDHSPDHVSAPEFDLDYETLEIKTLTPISERRFADWICRFPYLRTRRRSFAVR